MSWNSAKISLEKLHNACSGEYLRPELIMQKRDGLLCRATRPKLQDLRPNEIAGRRRQSEKTADGQQQDL